MRDLGVDFHGRRGLKQAELRAQQEREAEQERERRLLADADYQRQLREEEERRQWEAQLRMEELSPEEQVSRLTGLPLSPTDRLWMAGTHLAWGVGLGSSVGWIVGTAFALRRGFAPMRVGWSGALSMGVLGGQFVGIHVSFNYYDHYYYNYYYNS